MADLFICQTFFAKRSEKVNSPNILPAKLSRYTVFLLTALSITILHKLAQLTFHWLQECQDMMDEPLLQFFCKVWEEYRFSSQVLHGICNYLNRHWVKREHEKGHMDVYEVYSVSCLVYKLIFLLATVVLQSSKNALSQTILSPFWYMVEQVQSGQDYCTFSLGESMTISYSSNKWLSNFKM